MKEKKSDLELLTFLNLDNDFFELLILMFEPVKQCK